MEKKQKLTIVFLLLAVVLFLAGCGNKFFDPTLIGRFRPTPAVNVILDSLGVAEEASVAWEKAEDPKPSDIVAVTTDYVFRSGDVVRISIFELYQEGLTFVNDYIVTETGKISIPEVGIVQAAGLTETQLESEIKQVLSPSVLREPSVSAALLSSQQRTFSVLGDGVIAPNRYEIPRYDFRLADALAKAGGPRQFNVSYIYISRRFSDQKELIESIEQKRIEQHSTTSPLRGGEKISELEMVEPRISKPNNSRQGMPEPQTAEPEKTQPSSKSEREMLEIKAPSSQLQWPQSKKIITSSAVAAGNKDIAMDTALRESKAIFASNYEASAGGGQTVTRDEGRGTRDEGKGEAGRRVEWVFRDGKWVPVPVTLPEPTEPAVEEQKAGARVEWVFKDGRWVPVPVGPSKPAEKAVPEVPAGLEQKTPQELQWEAAVRTRVIKIPVAKLLAGDPRYNIVIKPGDAIYVPVDIIGEFAIMGNINRAGYINITGRPMTLKMAIAAAGGLGPLAWPKRCEVIRRIGENKEEIVMVDLDKIASGEQPDFFIKPNDLINVGSHATARWRAILRNAFRATYGFGFVYDRNFADADYGKGFPRWF